MNILRILSRILVGCVFIFSGFVKAVDPLGSVYKFNDYFTAFGIDFLSEISLPLAIFLSCIELVIGINLFTGIRMRITSWAVLIFMSFFLILTFYIALTNPVTDCGCFGDALILTNWQTFWKNMIFMALTILIFISRNKYEELYKTRFEWGFITIFFIASVSISLFCYQNLPILDFRAYNIGTNIAEKMVIPENAPSDEYENILLYEKNGIQKEFTEKNMPWQDTTWKWVESKSFLIKKGYTPPIHDFSITSLDGIDITDKIINDPGYSFLLISYKISESNSDAFTKANLLAFDAQTNGISFYCLTASTNQEIEQLKSNTKIDFDFYITDEITLKTIVRSNPGLVLIKDGNIIGKWHYRNFPESEQLFSGNILAHQVQNEQNIKEKYLTYLFCLGFLLILACGKISLKRFEKNYEN